MGPPNTDCARCGVAACRQVEILQLDGRWTAAGPAAGDRSPDVYPVTALTDAFRLRANTADAACQRHHHGARPGDMSDLCAELETTAVARLGNQGTGDELAGQATVPRMPNQTSTL